MYFRSWKTNEEYHEEEEEEEEECSVDSVDAEVTRIHVIRGDI